MFILTTSKCKSPIFIRQGPTRALVYQLFGDLVSALVPSQNRNCFLSRRLAKLKNKSKFLFGCLFKLNNCKKVSTISFRLFSNLNNYFSIESKVRSFQCSILLFLIYKPRTTKLVFKILNNYLLTSCPNVFQEICCHRKPKQQAHFFF